MPGVWRRFAIFYALTFVLLVLVPLLEAVLPGGDLDFDAMAARASAKTGIAWTSNIVSLVRLAFVEPGLWLLALGSAVPSLAALFALALSGDRQAWRSFARRLSPLNRAGWRRNAEVYIFGALALVACLAIARVIRDAAGGFEYPPGPGLFSAAIVPALLAAAFLDQGALLEEAGWRGYAAPLLQENAVSPLAAALIVGLAWGLWHAPRDIFADVVGRLGMARYLTLYLPSFVLGTVAVSVIAVFLMNRLGGGLWPAIMAHGLTNDSVGISGVADITQALTPYHQITKAAPLAGLALVIVLVAGKRLGLDKRTGG